MQLTRSSGPEAERPAVVRMRGVTVGYGDRPVVRDADLEVHDGEVVAVLGANGSGKTTLLRGLLGLAEVQAGTVEVLGRPLRHRRDRSRIGYVPQRHTLTGTVPTTVREVVSSGRLPRLGLLGRPRAHDREVVQQAIEAVDLGPLADRDLSELSGGQQRRTLIARALATEPAVLVMDEPTAGVDLASQHALAEVVRRLAAAGVTMVVVTHEVGPLAGVVSRVVVVEGGRIVSDGAPTARLLGLTGHLDAHDHGGADHAPEHGHDHGHGHGHSPGDGHHEDPPHEPRGWLDAPVGER
ncbi:metal ABC transporter ATP-binding protein [Angustibacter aerolatus]